jgi:hypothetical protein
LEELALKFESLGAVFQGIKNLKNSLQVMALVGTSIRGPLVEMMGFQ